MIKTGQPLGSVFKQRLNPRERRAGSRRFGKTLANIASHAVIILVGLFFFIPFLWMLSTAFKNDIDVFRNPPTLLPHDFVTAEVNGTELPLYTVQTENGAVELALASISSGMGTFYDPANPGQPLEYRMRDAEPILHFSLRWQNFVDAMNRSSRPGLNVNFWTYFRNSLFVASLTIIGTLLACAPVAYAFAKIKFPGRDILFILVLSTMMLPFQVTMIPLFLFFNDTLHWGNTFLPLIVPAFFANPYDVFLMRQFFRTIPDEMCDAARVDGASEFQIFTQLIIPLSTPVLATVAVFTFLWAWNDFLGPLLYLTSHSNYTMALGLQDFQGQHIVSYNLLMAASAIFTVPIIIAFFFAQKTFIQGIKLTGMKE